MTLADLYCHSADGRVELYWRHTSATTGNITVQYALDANGTGGWTTITSALSGTADSYSASFSNSTTPRWFRVTDDGGTATFADAAYANSGTFRDAQNYNIIPLGVGNKCIFIADASATPAGSNSNTGLGIASPILTYAYASGTIGINAGDHVLFKRGCSFSPTAQVQPPSGASSSAMSLVGAYGPVSTVRPILTFTETPGLVADERSHVAFIGISTTHTIPKVLTSLCSMQAVTGNSVSRSNIVVEDCYFELSAGVSVNAYATPIISGFQFRRCVVKDTHGVGAEITNGIYLSGTQDTIIEDCFFINCGFYDPLGVGNEIRNHNLYLDYTNDNLVVRNIVSIGNDVMQRCGPTTDRVLCINSPQGITSYGTRAWGGSWYASDHLISDCLLDGSTNNIFGGTPVDRGHGYRAGAPDYPTAGTVTFLRCLSNLASGANGLTQGNDRRAFYVYAGNGTTLMTATVTALAIDCVFTDTGVNGWMLIDHSNNSLAGLLNCKISFSSAFPLLVSENVAMSSSNMRCGGNTYWSANPDTTTFSDTQTWFSDYAASQGYTVSEFATLVGDPYVGYSLSVKGASAYQFQDPRRITDYAAHIGLAGTVAAYTSACAGMRRGAWNTAVTAEYAISWIRQGYGMDPLIVENYTRRRLSGNRLIRIGQNLKYLGT